MMGLVFYVLGIGCCMEYSVKIGSYSLIVLVVCGVFFFIFVLMMYKLVIWFFY